MAETLQTQIQSAPDFGRLRVAAIQLFELLTGRIWSDYNVHDGGVTILEQALYALTELEHKAGLPIDRLIGGAGKDSSLVPVPLAFFSKPVTRDDLQKIIIDIYGISNNWLAENQLLKPALFVNAVDKSVNMVGGETLPVKGVLEFYVELSSAEL